MTHFETEPLNTRPHTLVPKGEHYLLEIHGDPTPEKLTPGEATLWESTRQAGSISNLALSYFRRNQLPDFELLLTTIRKLVERQVILNPSARRALFHEANSLNESGLNEQNLTQGSAATTRGAQTAATTAPKLTEKDLSELPFFRNLPRAAQSEMLAHHQVYSVAPRTRVITQGQNTRDLFVILKGTADIYRREAQGSKWLAQLTSPSVFGEAGFLLARPRSADVITRTEATLARFSSTPNLDGLLKESSAENLHRRIWVLHALATSTLFQNLPSEALDELTFAGHLKRLPAGTTIIQEGNWVDSPQKNCFYIVVQGEATVSQGGRIIHHLRQGTCFGEVALLATGGQRTATVTTTAETILEEIPSLRFYELLARNLWLAAELQKLAKERLLSDQIRLQSTQK